MARAAWFALVVVFACSKPDDVFALRDRAIAVAVIHGPAVDVQVRRIALLKLGLRGNLPGWENALRIAELANDELGLPPFTQIEPPGPGWKPSPASLLGIAPYVEMRANQLAADRRRGELQFLVEDERARYARGIASVDDRIGQVERWIASPHP
jgi:hypothetical protein